MEDALLPVQGNLLNSNADDKGTEASKLSNALTIAAIAGGVIFVGVLYLYRTGRLKEDHALLWLFASVSMVLLSTWTGLLIAINSIVGAQRIPDVVLSGFVTLLIIVSIYYSVKISELTDQNKKIAQELAISRMFLSPLHKIQEQATSSME